ncbi:Phosphatidylinositol 4-kinase alpha [Xylographa carneopallida]|nr:Phosphatidylinositol 4-kinase alpha [Xylographa carneopallida]
MQVTSLIHEADDEEDGEEEEDDEDDEEADEFSNRTDSRHLSLRVTHDHRMYGQTGRFTSDMEKGRTTWKFQPNRSDVGLKNDQTIAKPPRLVTASTLIPECDESCGSDCVHSRDAIRMLACADMGRTPSGEEAALLRRTVQDKLLLSDEQLPHFLEFFGFWLGDGCMQYSRGWSGCNAVCCSQVKTEDVAFLREKVPLMGLTSRDVYWRTDEQPRRDQSTTIVTTLLITATRWFDFFNDEYGVKYRASTLYDRAAALSRMGCVINSSQSNRAVPQPAPSSRCSTASTVRSVSVSSPSTPSSTRRLLRSLSVDSMSDDDPVVLANGEERQPSEVQCLECQKDVDDDLLLLCDGCDEAFHTYCLDPALVDVPDGDWLCDLCCAAAAMVVDEPDTVPTLTSDGREAPLVDEVDEDGMKLTATVVMETDEPDDDAPADPDSPTKSAKWLPSWAILCLTRQQSRLVVDGLWRADGAWKWKKKVIHTSGLRLRDQLMQLLLHAGFTPYCRFLYGAGTDRAYAWHNQQEDRALYTLKYVHSLSEEEQANYSPITATTDGWGVAWATTDDSFGEGSCWPTIRCQSEIEEQKYDRAADGRIWCVTLRDVDDEDTIIVAQRAVRDKRGVVTKQSRPIFTGNCHPVDQVVFYLAQIIQSLRNDSFGLLYDFLLKSSHFSILLSHQLIWLCQAELGEVKETGKPLEMTPFRRLCQSLLDTIIANFTPAERSYYRDEVGFFEQVTAISGILKPLPTKAERKAKIKAELEQIEVKRGLYLPTNPHLQVKEIICKSGTPMRSAAKVPILVAFIVAEGELREDWIRNGGREEEITRARSLTAIRAQTQHHVAAAGAANGMLGGSKLLSAEERKLAQAERSAQEEKENHKVVDKYPVVIDTADEANKKAQPRLLQRHLSDSSIQRHVSPSSDNTQPAPLDDTLDTTADDDAAAQIETTATDSPTESSAPTFPMACIFKVGDDCRQDALALQIIQWCKTIFQLHSLPLFLYPYRVLPNRTGEEGLIGGIIECVPAAQTRDEIGRATGGSLKQYYLSRFGREESSAYQQAVRNFIMSQAAYAVTSHILQVKDRHNGNLMFDEAGHVIHIDFGFIFDISPAGNLKFERRAFKLTTEMVELMGGSVDSPLYRWFQLLVVRGFLAVREHLHEILAIVQPMLGSSLTCFRGDSLGDLKGRFFDGRSEREAAEGMLDLIYWANDSFYTTGYDKIQHMQQGVFYYNGQTGE